MSLKPTKRRNKTTEPNREQIFGLHAVEAALESPAGRVTEIWLADARDDKRAENVRKLAADHNIQVVPVSRHDLDERLGDARHQGCLAFCRPLQAWGEKHLDTFLDTLDEAPFLLVLDGVQDPHNLGACLRTAEAAGVHAVIAPKDRAAGLTAAAIKISSGSAERVPFVQITNLARTLREFQQRGIWIVGTSGESETTLYQADFKGPLALVLGAEGSGIRRLTRESCDQVIFIPMQGQAESLNVSVAAGVCLYEAQRQRSL